MTVPEAEGEVYHEAEDRHDTATPMEERDEREDDKYRQLNVLHISFLIKVQCEVFCLIEICECIINFFAVRS